MRVLTVFGLVALAVSGCSSANSTNPATGSATTRHSSVQSLTQPSLISHLRTVELTDVTISATQPATFEQIHLMPGNIDLRTNTRTPLLACPGGWAGTAVTAGPGAWGRRWLGEECISFSADDPAVLPRVDSTDQHYAIAVLAPTGTTSHVDLALSYIAGDDAEACFVANSEVPCR